MIPYTMTAGRASTYTRLPPPTLTLGQVRRRPWVHCSQWGNRFCPSPPTRVTCLTRTRRTNKWERVYTVLRGEGGVPPRKKWKGAREREWGQGEICGDHITEQRVTGRRCTLPQGQRKALEGFKYRTKTVYLGLSHTHLVSRGRQDEALPSSLVALPATPATTELRPLTQIRHLLGAYKPPSLLVRDRSLPVTSKGSAFPCKPLGQDLGRPLDSRVFPFQRWENKAVNTQSPAQGHREWEAPALQQVPWAEAGCGSSHLTSPHFPVLY